MGSQADAQNQGTRPDVDEGPLWARAARAALRITGITALLGLLVYTLIGQQRPLAVGEVAPIVASAVGLDGNPMEVNLASGMPTVVNIWATWCPPCLQEMPEFARVSEKLRGRVQFYGLAVESPRPQVIRLVERMGIPYPIAVMPPGSTRAWNATSLPSTYVLDGQGKVVWSIRGAIDGHTLEDKLAPLLQ